MEDLDIAVEIDPNSAQVHFNRGHILQSLGRYEAAEKSYTKVLDLVPTDHEAYKLRGQT